MPRDLPFVQQPERLLGRAFNACAAWGEHSGGELTTRAIATRTHIYMVESRTKMHTEVRAVKAVCRVAHGC